MRPDLAPLGGTHSAADTVGRGRRVLVRVGPFRRGEDSGVGHPAGGDQGVLMFGRHSPGIREYGLDEIELGPRVVAHLDAENNRRC